MKNRIFTLVCFVLLFSNFSVAQNDKAAARDFGLSIVQSFFDQNCDFMFDHLDQTILSIEGGQKIDIKEEMRRLFCSESPLRSDITVNYQLYEDNYAPVVYNNTELMQKFPAWANLLNMQPTDYFFDGSNPIAAGNTRLFRAGEMARFVLRKVNTDWIIIAI